MIFVTDRLTVRIANPYILITDICLLRCKLTGSVKFDYNSTEISVF